MMDREPIYIPHMGIACTLGIGKEAVAHSLFNGETSCPLQHVTLLSDKTVPMRAFTPTLGPLPAEFKDRDTRNNRLLKLALDEIAEGVEEARKTYGSHRIGVIMATSTSGMAEGEQAFTHQHHSGTWPKDYAYTMQETSSSSLFATQYLGLTGPSYTISTACSSSSKALCSAQRLIRAGICDAVIVGGVDTLCQLTLNGFDALELITQTLCTPFSKNRSGITIGEGAAVFILTKEKSTIEFAGGGESSDAYHISSPDPNGQGAERAIREALKQAQLKPQDISYINLHGTGTLLNDAIESHCIHRIFGSQIPCSSTKALTGHTLGASGALEAAFLWLALSREHLGTIPLPPHIWDEVEDPTLAPLGFVNINDRVSRKPLGFALMSNAFAFGGSNVSIILRKR